MRNRNPTISLEEYSKIFRDPSHLQHLSVPLLQKIIHMHGFLRMHKRYKHDITAALESIVLMSPTRTTIGGDATAARLTVAEVRSDLEAIGWTECPVSEVVGIGNSPAEEAAVGPKRFAGKRQRSKRKRGSINVIILAEEAVAVSEPQKEG